jgi:hypothetical protein
LNTSQGGLALNNFLEYNSGNDYKKVSTSIPGKRRRNIITKSMAAARGSIEDYQIDENSRKLSNFDVLSHQIQISKYVTEKDK